MSLSPLLLALCAVLSGEVDIQSRSVPVVTGEVYYSAPLSLSVTIVQGESDKEGLGGGVISGQQPLV